MSPYLYNLIFGTITVIILLSAWTMLRLVKPRHNKAATPAHDGRQEAQQIVQDAHVISEEVKNAVQQHTLAAINRITEYSERAMKELQTRHTQELDQQMEHLKTITTNYLNKLTEHLKQRSTAIEQDLETQTRSNQARLQAELTIIKNRVREHYEKYLQAQFPAIIKAATKQMLTPKDHEQFIRDALRSTEHELWPEKPIHEPPPQQPPPPPR